jgi:hypothetical protein
MASRAAAVAFAMAGLAALVLAAPARASTEDARAAIEAFDPAKLETLGALDDARAAPGDIDVAQLRPLLASADVNRRWAAAYVTHAIADGSSDLQALRPRLRDPDPSVRALAAFALAGNGLKDGLAALVPLVANRALMANSDGQSLSTLAEERLQILTRAGKRGPGPWRRWWRKVRSTIRWDRQAERYRWNSAKPRKPKRATLPPSPPVAHAAAGTVVIPIRVQIFWGAGVTSDQQVKILKNIREAVDLLNGGGRTGRCQPLSFELDLVEGGSELGEYYSIDVNEIKETHKARWGTSWIQAGFRNGRLWTGSAAGPRGDELIAHEFGHIAGLPDEYYEYVDANGKTQTAPIDPESFMADEYNGSVLQRHLDFLAGRHDPAGEVGCERWAVTFPSWTSRLDAWTDGSGSTTTNWLGLSAIARVSAYFWVRAAGGAFTPAGKPICGQEVISGFKAASGSGRNTPCPESSLNSQGLDARMAEGNADCGSPAPNLRFDPARWDTAVTGSRSGNDFHIRLKVADLERAEAIHCEPAAEPSITRSYSLIRDGMRFAGAHDFTMSPPTRDFRKDTDHEHAFGQASLALVPPAG